VARKKSKVIAVTWTASPAEHDYPAAESFLRLIATPELIAACIRSLAHAPTVLQHAKDILRAAGLPLLPIEDPEVAKDLKSISKGIALSPILLIGGNVAAGHPLQIADGYHRVCASYHVDENTDIPCRIVDLP
jgi:hypothetical protein